MSERTVVGSLPDCDFHSGVKAEVDGKTISGPWANMCGPCYAERGVGLGAGKGQVLVLRAGGRGDNQADFEAFMANVDRVLVSRIGLGSGDLGDARWRDYFIDELTPEQAIEAAFEDGYLDVPEDLLFA
jgi:hypothetical protein